MNHLARFGIPNGLDAKARIAEALKQFLPDDYVGKTPEIINSTDNTETPDGLDF